jgi:preprotein translocase subunit SecE
MFGLGETMAIGLLVVVVIAAFALIYWLLGKSEGDDTD